MPDADARTPADGSELPPSETSPLLAPRTETGEADAVPIVSQPDAPAPNQPSPMAGKMHLLVPAVGLGVFIAALDQLLTVATYAKIGTELDALSSTSWVFTAYFLTLTSFQPLYGRLSDIFGRKPCLLFAYAVFALGCLGCGLAQSMAQLCAARAVAGVGGGGMSAVVSILLSDLVPLRDRGVWQGYINILFAAGTSTGAPLGGLLADSVGWRWSFLGQVPLCAAAFLAVYFVLDLPPVSHDHWLTRLRQVDFAGAFTLILAVTALLVGLDSGSNLGWSHIVTIVSLSITPGLFAAFLLVEVKFAARPIAPGHVIFNRSLFACYLANFFGVAGQMSVIFFMPLVFQAVQARSATVTGALLVPGTVTTVISSLWGGWMIRLTGRFYWVTVAAYGVLLLALLPLMLSVTLRSVPGEVVGLVMVAFGSGCGITTTLIALLANAAVEDTAVVVACSYLFRSLGTSIGISTTSAVLQHILQSQLAARLSDDEDARDVEKRVRQSLEVIKELPPRLAEKVRSSYQTAVVGSFALVIVYTAIAFVSTFWIKEKEAGLGIGNMLERD